MDPNETLAQMRAAIAAGKQLHEEASDLCDEANETGTENNEFEVREAASDQDQIAAMRAADLDEWLSKGGALPDAWRKS
jgi:hypothetical protein